MLGIAPIQIKANLANSGGFIFPHEVCLNKNLIKQRIQILLSGYLGEKLIFGIDKVSAGASNDIAMAIKLAAEYVRIYGFGNNMIKAVVSTSSSADYALNQDGYGNNEIQRLIDKQILKASHILQNYKKLLIELSLELVKKENIEIDEYLKLCQKYNLNLTKKSQKHQIIENYYQILRKAKTQIKIK